MLLAVYWYMLLWFPLLRAQPSARELDSLLQDYAFRALVRPKTGVPYDGNAPSNLTGIKISALRLRSGSLRRKGFSSYKEFHIPVGVTEQPYVKRLVLVYQNLANLSEFYYPLPGFTYLAPVVGLLAYNASDLSAKNLSELDIRASKDPILINFSRTKPAPEGVLPKCVYFGTHGSLEFNNVIDQHVCPATNQGHFAIAVEYIAPAPAPAPGRGENGNGNKNKKWIIVSSVVGGGAMLVLLGGLVVCLKRCRDRKKIEGMEAAADKGVPLSMASVGVTKAPVASQMRTRPVLENEYVI